MDNIVLQMDRDVFPDKLAERLILNAHVICPSHKCDWRGELRDVKTHLTKCPYEFIECTNDGCVMKIRRMEMQEHAANECNWRTVLCGYCSEQLSKNVAELHLQSCVLFPMKCVNGCGSETPRQEVQKHLNESCPLTIVACPYQHLGCEQKTGRKAMDSHVECSSGLHLHLACVKLNDVSHEINALKTDRAEMKEELKELKKEFEEKLSNTKLEFQQQIGDLRRALAVQSQATEETQKGLETVNVGPFIWRIDNFEAHQARARTRVCKAIYSPPFYSWKHGYHMKFQVFPNGRSDGKDTHLSVFVVIVKGEYDALQSWPFKGKVKMSLLRPQDETGDCVSHVVNFLHAEQAVNCRPDGDRKAGRGKSKFVALKDLKTNGYLVDDVIFLKAEAYRI